MPGYIDIQTNGAFGVDYTSIAPTNSDGSYASVAQEVAKSDYDGNSLPVPSSVKLVPQSTKRGGFRRQLALKTTIEDNSERQFTRYPFPGGDLLPSFSSLSDISISSTFSNNPSTNSITSPTHSCGHLSVPESRQSTASDIFPNTCITNHPTSTTLSEHLCRTCAAAKQYVEQKDRDLMLVGRLQPRFGVTAYCPTVISSSATTYTSVIERFQKYMQAVSVCHQNGIQLRQAQILGLHLEGPFISVPGAHEVAVLRAPSGPPEKSLLTRSVPEETKTIDDPNNVSAFTNVMRRYGGQSTLDITSIVTMAPELEGALESIAELSKRGVVVSMGHSEAGIDIATSAVEAGARLITHLFNAMKAFHHRDPGLVGLLGANHYIPSDTIAESTGAVDTSRLYQDPNRRVHYSIIADGIHVHPFAVKIAYDSHQRGAVLVTDSMSAMGLGPGQYNLGAMQVELKSSDGKRAADKAVVAGTNTLAGAVVTLEECVQNFRAYTGCTTATAVLAASRSPAEVLGIYPRKGSLLVGSDADIVLLDPMTLAVRATIINGQLAYVDSPTFPPALQ